MTTKAPRFLAGVLLLLSTFACDSASPERALTAVPRVLQLRDLRPEEAKPIDVSLIALIGNPERYSGRTVRVVGTALFEFEGTALFLAKEDYREFNILNAVKMVIAGRLGPELTQFNGRTVLVCGVFEYEPRALSPVVSGYLRDLVSIESWPVAMTKFP